MKNYKSAIASPLLMSPKINLGNVPLVDILSSLKHSRCFSVKNSPYFTQNSTKQIKPVLNCKSRLCSPKNRVKKNKDVKKNSCKTKDKNLSKKTGKNCNVINGKKKKNRNVCSQDLNKLKNLEGKNIVYAPKIFENQLFRDVYDNKGNHDRVVELSDVSHDKSLLGEGKIAFSPNFIQARTKDNLQKIRPPDNSYLEETEAPNDLYQDVLKKLKILEICQKNNLDLSRSNSF